MGKHGGHLNRTFKQKWYREMRRDIFRNANKGNRKNGSHGNRDTEDIGCLPGLLGIIGSVVFMYLCATHKWLILILVIGVITLGIRYINKSRSKSDRDTADDVAPQPTICQCTEILPPGSTLIKDDFKRFIQHLRDMKLILIHQVKDDHMYRCINCKREYTLSLRNGMWYWEYLSD